MDLQKLISTHLLKRSLLSYFLYPFSLIFSAFLVLRRKYYHLLNQSYKAPVFIISIGNIVSGGTGKTPFTIWLAKSLSQSGVMLAVSHRGYKSGNDAIPHLISSRETLLPEADKFGDEAYLLAKNLPGIPIITGRSRKSAIQLLLLTYPDLECIILDDSFQHLAVQHDLDIIIIHEQTGFGNGFILPAGYLREPVSALKNADIIITNRYADNPDLHLRKQLQALCPLVYSGKTMPGSIYFAQHPSCDLLHLVNNRLLLFSAIGNPAGFEQTAKAMGLNIIGTLEYPDHYDYKNPAAWHKLKQKFKALNADYYLTTEKDYAKIMHLPELKLPILILPISFVPDTDDNALTNCIMDKMQG